MSFLCRVASATSAFTAPLFEAAAQDTLPSRARSRICLAAFAWVSTSAAPSARASGVRRSSPRCAAFPAAALADAPSRRPAPAEADLRGATPRRCIADPDASVSQHRRVVVTVIVIQAGTPVP